MKSLFFALIGVLFSQAAFAEDLLLTSNKWLSDGTLQAHIYCSLRGMDMMTGSIRCSTEVMEKLSDRHSHLTERKSLSASGGFEFAADEMNVLGRETFYLSGRVIRKGPSFQIEFAQFKHELKIFEILPALSVDFRNFSTLTEAFPNVFQNETYVRDSKACVDYQKFEKDRVPQYCEFHGFLKSHVEFPIPCNKVGPNEYLVTTQSSCFD
jgi:hypothetical protein